MKVKRLLLLYLVPSVMTIGSLLPIVTIQHTSWGGPLVNEPLHSTMVALGAFASIIISLLLFQGKKERYGEKYFLFAMGFLTMGLFEGFHAITKPGQEFVLLHSIASLTGGFWFALVWLPHSTVNRIESWNKWFPLSVTAGSVLFGIWTLLFKEALPLMVENGKFTTTTVAINSLAGVFFLTAAGRLLLEFRRFDKSETYLFACMSLLFGLSGLVIPHSQIWCPHWWWWHLLRLSAYLLAIGLVTYWYLQTVSALRVSITERKQTEKALQESEKTYRHLIENLQEGIWVIDKDAYTTFVNPPMAEMLGYTVDEMLGKHLFSFMDERVVEIAKQKLEQRKQGIKEQHDFEFIRKDGKRIFTNLETAPIIDDRGDYIGAIAGVMDITERKQAEEALRNEKAFTESALNTLTDIFFVFDLEGRFLRWNKTMTAISGYSDEEISSMKPIDFFSVEDAKRVAEAIEIVVKEGSGSLEATVVTKDGRHIPYEYIASLLKNKEGKPVGICGSGRDITERKKAEEALRESEKKYRDLVYNALVGIYKTNLKGDFLFANDALTKIFEFQSQEEIMAESAQARYKNPKDRDIFIDNLKKTGRIESFETELLTKTGKTKNVLLSATLEGEVLSGMVIDITERKRAEEELRNTKEYLEKLTNALPDMIFTVKFPERTHEYVNSSGERILGYNNQECIGKSTLMFYANEDEFIDLGKKLITAIEQGKEIVYTEQLLKRKNGEVFLGELTLTFLKEDGKVIRLIGIIRDITERKQAEQALKKLHHHSELILNSAAEGIIGLDSQGNHTFVNPSAASMLGYEAEELIGENSHTIWHHSMDDGSTYPEDECPIYTTLKDGKVHLSIRDEVFWRKDGTSFSVAYSSNPIMDEGKIIGAVVNFRDITERKKAEEQIKRQVGHLAALRDIDRAITSSFDLRITLKIVLDEVAKQLQVDAADVLLFNHHLQTLEYAAGLGFRTTALQHTRLPMGKGHAGQAAIERRIISIPNLSEATSDLTRAPLFANEGFVSYFAVPLIAKGQIKGVLEIFHHSLLEPEQEWLDFLDALATQAAIAIDNAELFNSLQRSNIDLIMAYDATIEGWSRALDYRDKETEGHSRRVTEMTVKIAQTIGMNDAELAHVRRGALLHDIGKMGIPDSILLKPGRLTAEEWEIMRKHPVFAYDLLSPVDFLRPALDIPYCHHEKWDGTGYTRGLKGEQIPLSARIFSVVDVWDALCSDRPYRPAWSEEKAKEYIQQQAGKDFDPKVVEIFFKMEW